ncbi:UNVERIFIED_CONTAM: hypothetical protein Sradi_3895300 [Sesamum radiatum]|uniref:B-block binding subunit of TFIIIC n=1 Tax=Sesamum radiatum TaxID=300843 RepID=A0AAW2PE94_SESRA
MDSVVHSALEEICCEAANGLHLRDLWPKLSPCLASRGLPLCPNVKRAVWENLAEIPGLKVEACDYASCSNATEELTKCDVEVCEKLNVKIVAPEAMRKSFLGIYEMEASESSLSDTQRLILERLAVARANGIAQSELAKELHIAANNLFYQLKRLEIQRLIVRHPTVIRKKQASSSREQNNGSIVATNMLYLYRYGKHLGCQQRLEITKEDNLLMEKEVADGHTETFDDFGKEIAKEDIHVKDFLPALKAICDKLENSGQGQACLSLHFYYLLLSVLVVADLKRDLGYRGTSGHRAWRNICHRLKEAQVVEECYTLINKKEEKFLIKPELHRRLESLEKKKNKMMDRKTLERSLNKLQQEGHCKCIHVSVPVVTNCGRSRTTEVVLHPSVYSVSPELLAQIHEKMRSFEIHVRQQSYVRQKKGESVPMLHNVQRIPNSLRLDVQSERAEVMRANGFVLAKMVRTKLLHIFLWGWIRSSPGWNDGLASNNHSYDLKNPHSSCKLFELDRAIRSMPLELFLQVVGSAQKFDDMVEKCRSGLLLSDLPMEEYKGLMDTRATGRLSWLIDILRRLKLIRLVSKGHAEDGASSPHTTLTHALELKPYVEEPVSAGASSGLTYPDLRPQVRHDFVLSSRKAVDEYWNTLEYCYAAAKSRAALLAFPGSAVHEVFHSRSWASVRVMTADQRVELLKRIAKDDPNKRLSFGDCEKIANDLNLTLEQVLRVYYDKRKLRLTRSQRVLDAEDQELQTVKGKCIISSRKRKRYPDRMSSKLAKASMADGQSSGEAVGPLLDSDTQFMEEQNCVLTTSEDYDCQLRRYHAGDEIEGSEVLKLTKKIDRRLVIEYARRRAALGAKFHRVDWASISNLPAPPGACKRRMASLNSYIPFRKAVMKLCNMLAEHYAKYLETIQEKVLNHGHPGKMASDSEEDISCSPAPMSGEWVNFDEGIVKETLDDVLRYKRMAKLEAYVCPVLPVIPIRDFTEEDFEGCGGGAKASSRRSSSQQLPRKYLKLLNKGASVSRRMHESVAIANAAELFKLIFLNKSTAPEVPALLAETLRRYSEHDLFAALTT